MSVNNMSIEQAYALVNEIHEQATGNKSIAPVDFTSFVSVAQATLAAGYEPVLNAITQVLTKTLIAVRPYSRKFSGLEVTADRWGGIVRKISFGDRGAVDDPTYQLVDGQSIDQFEVRKADAIETRYVGSVEYMGTYTIYTRQLDVAFSNPAEFASFMSGLMTHFSNEREQWLENLSRTIVSNLIAAENVINNTESVVKLLTEYNAATGLTLTATTVMQPANFKPFMQWVYARISNLSRMMTERSELFQQKMTGHLIARHTPKEDQKVYMLANYLDAFDAQVLADTYHDNFLAYADVEPVTFWQDIKAPDQIQATPVYVDSSGIVTNGTAQTMSKVVGVIFDRDAAGYNIYQNELSTSPYNAAGQYYNIFSHMRVQLQNDVTEKAAILLLA